MLKRFGYAIGIVPATILAVMALEHLDAPWGPALGTLLILAAVGLAAWATERP